MKELGRKGGKANGRVKPERVHESLRAYLKREVSPAEVWAALKLALEGQNESARVSAARVLLDALAAPSDERAEEQRRQLAEAGALARLADLVSAHARTAPTKGAREALADLSLELDQEALAVHPDLLVGDVSAERAGEIFAQLEEAGLVATRVRVARAERERDEALARLQEFEGVAA